MSDPTINSVITFMERKKETYLNGECQQYHSLEEEDRR